MFVDLFKENSEAFFVYDILKLEHNLEKIKKMFPEVVYFFYSVKSNPNPFLIKKISSFDRFGFDVSSSDELSAILKLGIQPSRITFSGPAKNDSAVKLIKKQPLNSVHIDSEEEYQIFANTSQGLTLRIPLEESFSQKVGLSHKSLNKILSECPEKRFKGVHLYLGRERAGSEIAQSYLITIKELFAKYKSKFINIPEVYFGPGLPQLDQVLESMIPRFDAGKINIECGRAISSNIGSYLTPILTIKKRDKNILIIDGGLQHLATHFSSPKFGQKYVSVNYYNSSGEKIKHNGVGNKSDVYGSLGVWHDLMLKDIEVPQSIKSGDWLEISPAGSYGVTASTNQFIGASFPKEYLKNNNEYTLVSPTNFTSYLDAGIYENSSN